MNQEHQPARTRLPLWTILLVAIAALVLATAALSATVFARGSGVGVGFGFGGMMSGWNGTAPVGPRMMGGGYGGIATAPGPGESGFVAGTAASPRVVRVLAGPGTFFTPATIAVQRGETITFEVTTMGPSVHEFMVGPADAVAADMAGTPEVADIGMMQTKALTYTFDGAGPYAYACHAPGHYEAGMRGAITIAG